MRFVQNIVINIFLYTLNLKTRTYEITKTKKVRGLKRRDTWVIKCQDNLFCETKIKIVTAGEVIWRVAKELMYFYWNGEVTILRAYGT